MECGASPAEIRVLEASLIHYLNLSANDGARLETDPYVSQALGLAAALLGVAIWNIGEHTRSDAIRRYQIAQYVRGGAFPTLVRST